MTVATALFGDSTIAARTRIVPVIYGAPTINPAAIEEKVRREEALRWLLVDSLYKPRLAAYLREYARNPGSTVGWAVALDSARVPRDTILARMRDTGGTLAAHWRSIEKFALKDPITLLVDNRELIPIKNRTELPGVLDYCKSKRKEP